MKVEITGVNKLLIKLGGITNEVRKEADTALMFNGRSIEKNAKLRVPTDTGRLKTSLDVYKLGEMSYQIGTNVKYAPYVEFGTKSKTTIPAGLENYAKRFQSSNGSLEGGMHAQPFLFPSFEQEKKEIIKNLKQIVDKKR